MFKDRYRYAISDIRSWDEPKIQIGYCELQHLFMYSNRVGYNAGTYGWNFDIYNLGDKVICTGYRSMIGRKPKVNVREWDEKARAITSDYSISVEEKKVMLDRMIDELAKVI